MEDRRRLRKYDFDLEEKYIQKHNLKICARNGIENKTGTLTRVRVDLSREEE